MRGHIYVLLNVGGKRKKNHTIRSGSWFRDLSFSTVHDLRKRGEGWKFSKRFDETRRSIASRKNNIPEEMINFRARRFYGRGDSADQLISEMQRSPTSRRYFQFSSPCLTSVKGNGRKSTEWKKKRKRTRKAERRKGEANDHTYRIHDAWIHETIILIFTGKIHKGTNGTYTTKTSYAGFLFDFRSGI